jgi:hypothetical protein
MCRRNLAASIVAGLAAACFAWAAADDAPPDAVRPELIVRDRYAMDPPHFSKDSSVKIDYDIVYVRALHHRFVWPDVGAPTLVEPGADLMLLHPDGKQERLVEGGERGSVADPSVSFDGQSVYYTFFYAGGGADIYKIHVPSRKLARLTNDGGKKAPGTEGARYVGGLDSQVLFMELFDKPASKRDVIYNTGPCPVPGGKVVFTSNRHGFVPREGSFTSHAFQLTVMDDDGGNVETIGHLNLGCALHPVILTDGRIIFSSLENQGLRDVLHWSIWSIYPDGTHWNPLISDFFRSLASSFHFQTQRSDGRVVVEMYYNVNQAGFGTLVQLPAAAPPGVPAFGPGDARDPRNPPLRMLAGGIREHRLPFSPYGIDVLTPFANDNDSPSPRSNPKDPKSPKVGRVTHPCGAPDNHVLVVWAPDLDVSRDGLTGAVRRVASDTGIYLIKAGSPVYEPGQMLLVKNDPKYHEQWPRPLVPYSRIHGIKEPQKLPWLANNGGRSRHLPEGTPYGLVGSSSLYKRESATGGYVPKGSVTAIASAKAEHGAAGWIDQGSDAGVYSNSDIHAIRILIQEPNLRADGDRTFGFFSHARERLRILGEIPVRHFGGAKTKSELGALATVKPPTENHTRADGQPTDPDGNPDTSFLAKIPADTSFTFQTLDKNGMVLNMAQTWHQVRPGEIRNDCGGCHAHSQQPTLFKSTAAARPDYEAFDVTQKTPLLTTKARDESGKKWDVNDQTGLRMAKGVLDVEYWRDIRPIFDRSCVACHSRKAAKPAGNLVLDDDEPVKSKHFRHPANLTSTYLSLVPVDNGSSATRYIHRMQARSSLLIWNVYGKRMDGRDNDAKIDPATRKPAPRYEGKIMPPPEAVAGTYKDEDGNKIKVAPLSDEERLTLVRWIDLGCPIDLSDTRTKGQARTGFFADHTLPTLTITFPSPGRNQRLQRILVGMADAYSGLDLKAFTVKADFTIDGAAPGTDLAAKFKEVCQGVWEYCLVRPIDDLPSGKMAVAVSDKQGNISRLERSLSVRRD